MSQISPAATLRELLRVRRNFYQIERRLGGRRAHWSLRRLLSRAELAIIDKDPDQLQKSYDELKALK